MELRGILGEDFLERFDVTFEAFTKKRTPVIIPFSDSLVRAKPMCHVDLHRSIKLRPPTFHFALKSTLEAS